MLQNLTFLAIGHFTYDVVPDGYVIGGAASYSTITAHRLGASARAVTSVGPQFDLSEARLRGIQIHALPAASTTIFHNEYDAEGSRTQHILGVAEKLCAAAVPPGWKTPDIAYLCPVANEVELSVARDLEADLIGATPQGWMRQWDASGRVRGRRWKEAEAFLQQIDVLILSEEDIRDYPEQLGLYIDLTPLVALTHGAEGATLYVEGKPIRTSAFPANEQDPTGAGDVFAAAFLLEYRRSQNPELAVRFGHAVASFAVEKMGTSGIPTIGQVLERLG